MYPRNQLQYHVCSAVTTPEIVFKLAQMAAENFKLPPPPPQVVTNQTTFNAIQTIRKQLGPHFSNQRYDFGEELFSDSENEEEL
jgi:hypothetical protein